VIVGLIPYVGQVADVRDIIAGIIEVVQEDWTEGKVPWLSIAFLVIAVIAIIPGADAVKVLKVVKPLLKAMGEKPLRELLDYMMRNPKDVARIGKIVWALGNNPQLVEVLAKHGDKAGELLTRGSPELIEVLAKHSNKVDELLTHGSPELIEALAKNPQLADEILSDPKKIAFVINRGATGVDILEKYDPKYARDVPGGGLFAQDGTIINKGDGGTTSQHTVERHVGKTDVELTNRSANADQKNGSSTFADLTTAERAVAEVMRANPESVNAVKALSQGETIEVPARISGGPSGRHVAQGASTATETHHAKVVLIRDESAPDGYRVLTAFPIPSDQYVKHFDDIAVASQRRADALIKDANERLAHAKKQEKNAARITDPVKRAQVKALADQALSEAVAIEKRAVAARRIADADTARRNAAIADVNSSPGP
jgi:hypothetical protein